MKAHRAAWCIVALVALAAALAALLAWRDSTYRVRSFGQGGVALGGRAAERAVGTILTGKPTVFWTPARRDIRRLEGALSRYAARDALSAAPWWAQARRQYIGFDREGQHRIYVVGFCGEAGVDERREFVPLAPAGCRFEAEYDLASQRLVFFWVDVQDGE